MDREGRWSRHVNLWMTKGDGVVMLIYGSRREMDFLGCCDAWMARAIHYHWMFLPPQFLQLYTIHGIKNGRNVIVFYALLTNKRRPTYEQLFQHVILLQVLQHQHLLMSSLNWRQLMLVAQYFHLQISEVAFSTLPERLQEISV